MQVTCVNPSVFGTVDVSWRNEDTTEVETEYHHPTIPMEDILMVMERGRRRRRSSRRTSGKEAEPTPEEAAANLKDIVGDGKGGVELPMDVGEKAFGNGFGAGLVVKITCDQSLKGYSRAIEAAIDIQEHYLPQLAEKAFEIFEAGAKKRKIRERYS